MAVAEGANAFRACQRPNGCIQLGEACITPRRLGIRREWRGADQFDVAIFFDALQPVNRNGAPCGSQPRIRCAASSTTMIGGAMHQMTMHLAASNG